jgi:tetratricopeptide (TPR) repeat protein/transglutaminase-like putative cysteine protease
MEAAANAKLEGRCSGRIRPLITVDNLDCAPQDGRLEGNRMRIIHLLLAASAISGSTAAAAADELKFGKVPAWVIPQAIPAETGKYPQAPVTLLLANQQLRFEPGKTISYGEIAMKIQTAEGLAAGNLSIPWDPARDTLTVNKLEIHRGKQVIDVLASGQTFTTLRRESNLELAMLDGVLTASIQPDGLQQGDIIVMATTTEHVDPVLASHVEANFAEWQMPIGFGYTRIDWPAAMNINTRTSGGLPGVQPVLRNGHKVIELSERDIEPAVPPKGAPARYKLGRLGEATDFSDWSDIAAIMLPLYKRAENLPTSGPLHDEVEKIRSSTNDPRQRAAKALQLVQERVRYVGLLMGQGGYVPADAEQTWSRRFGDCKAKTALLLGILHSLGISAEPALANVELGDVIADRLPAVSLFNHVLVRAHIAGKDYWLDGTRTGDTDLDAIEIPSFGWTLPLTEHATLVHTVPRPLDQPSLERTVSIDATNGIFAAAPTTIDEVYRGDTAVATNSAFSGLAAGQRDAALSNEAKGFFDTFTVDSSSVEFDKAKRELHIRITGSAKLNWHDSWFTVPTAGIAFDPDFDRPPGPSREAPFAVRHPRFAKDRATLRLPPGFAGQQKLSAPVNETLAGVEYARTEVRNGDLLTVDSSERSLVEEVPYKEATAAVARLRALNKSGVYLSAAVNYKPTEKDIVALAESAPNSADEYLSRGHYYFLARKYDEAIADFTAALKIDPDEKWARANRGLALVWKGKFEDAERDFAAVEAKDQSNSVDLRGHGLLAEFKGDCDKAVDYFTRSLASEPGSNFAIGHRAECEASLSKFDAALADSQEALTHDPSWMDLRMLRANIFMRQGKHDLVAAEAEAMTRENAASNYAWVGAGKMYAAIAQQDKAMAAFGRALELKPEAYIYVNRSQSRSRSDINGRLADLDAALKLEPDNSSALQEKARLFSERGDFKAALALLDTVKFTDADSADYLFFNQQQRAILLYKAGRNAEAEKLLAELRGKATDATRLNSLCWTLGTAGIGLDAALQACRDALKMKSGHGSYLDSLGMVLLKLGRLDEALTAYDQAVAQNVGAASFMGRAFVYERKGDRAHAEADAAAARKLNPGIDSEFAEYGLSFDKTPKPSASVASRPK